MPKRRVKKPREVGWTGTKARAAQAGSVMEVVRQPNGEVGFRVGETSLPTHEFEAEVAWAMKRFGAVSLCFGKTLPGDDRLRLIAEVRFGYEAFAAFWTATTEFVKTLTAWVNANRQSDGDRPNRDNLADLEHLSFAWYRANIAIVSHTGNDSELCFYAMPVSAVSQAIRDLSVRHIPIIPLIRVTCSSHELARFLGDCARIYEEVSPLLAADEKKRESKIRDGNLPVRTS